MRIATRIILTSVALVVVACFTLGLVFVGSLLFMGGQALDDTALAASNLVAQVADEEPVTALNTAVVPDSDVVAVGLYDKDYTLLDHRALDGQDSHLPAAGQVEDMAGDGTSPSVYVDGQYAVAVSPVAGDTYRYVAVVMSADALLHSLGQVLLFGGLATVLMAALAAFVAYWVLGRLARPVQALTIAAASLEQGEFSAARLQPVAARSDELGVLARQFSTMAEQVQAREQELTAQVRTLQIQIDEEARRRSVAEITETDSFAELQRKAAELRARNRAEEAVSQEGADDRREPQ